MIDIANQEEVCINSYASWSMGFHAGREAGAVEHAIEIMRLESRMEDCRTWLILSSVFLTAAVITAAGLIANGNIILVLR